MKIETHGGNLLAMAALSGRTPESLLDFSVNIRPEGTPDFLRHALIRAMDAMETYPSPHAEEVMEAAARHHGLPASRFVFGNGSNELIHALARVLGRQKRPLACIVEPAFSEYALACRLAGLPTRSIRGGLDGREQESAFALPGLAEVPDGAAVFLANPGNPSGLFRSREDCLELVRRHANLLWILDEAFIDYAGPEHKVSILRELPSNAVVLRSLTKFYALAGVRAGYLAASEELAGAVRAELPAWSVNCLAIAAAVAVLDDTSDFAVQARALNAERRAHLASLLATLPGLDVLPSAANYLLFRWPDAPKDLYATLLRRFGIAVRDCANYVGLEDGTWFRAAVRFHEDHCRLVEALRTLMEENRPARQGDDATRQCDESHESAIHETPGQNGTPPEMSGSQAPRFVPRTGRRPTPALMIQGTSSNAGKSILAAAFCRIFTQDGHLVAPFKAQNMSLNSGVTPAGEEMSRAQIVQAQAARVDPDVRMNPVLLKPHSDTGSQVVILGQAGGHMAALDYFAKKRHFWSTVTHAYDSLAAEHDIMVLEGAGSPGEINLKRHDIVNMRMAAHANAAVLLVGDIDRGGVYASFLGTWLTFTHAERRLLAGYLVNRFRGDASLLSPAHESMLASTGVPVLGTIPFIPDLGLPEEDMAGFSPSHHEVSAPTPEGILDIAVVIPRHVSNYTDFAPLDAEPDVRLRPVRRVEDWGNPHVVMLPGSKSVVNDLEALRASGLAGCIIEHARRGGWLLGICGGLQMLGKTILDPHGVESSCPDVPGLGLMDLTSTFQPGKTLMQVHRAATPLGVPTEGYEIHHALTVHGPSALPLFVRPGTEDGKNACGYVSGRCWASYLHGLFNDDTFRRAWIDHVRADLGLPVAGRLLARYDLERALDRLAAVVRDHVDMETIYRRLGLQ